ncbi:MAG: HAD family hydrolase [Erysipelotrichaceae bacterium]|nr:HAD family hydrolase [Erysipelotrichaceae bacterium]
MKQLLFFDIDGTLLDNDTHLVPQSALDALETAKQKGHELYFCTGRSWGMRDELNYMGIDSAVICNGAGIVHHGDVLYVDSIDQDVALATLKKIDELGGGFQALTWKYGYQNDKCHEGFTRVFKLRWPDTPVQETFDQKGMHYWHEYTGDPILKIDYTFDTKEQTDAFLDSLDPSIEYIAMLSYLPGEKGFYGEMMHRGANKGTGVRKVCEILDIPIEQTVGFGDSLNDEPMLNACHTSVVMGNGMDELKAKADFITKATYEDGIAYAMKTLDII